MDYFDVIEKRCSIRVFENRRVEPEVVNQLLAAFETVKAEIPELPIPESGYLFEAPKPGEVRTLMRLIGGELRYDRVPESQKHLLKQRME